MTYNHFTSDTDEIVEAVNRAGPHPLTRNRLVSRLNVVLVILLCAWLSGCDSNDGSVKTAATGTDAPAAESPLPPQQEPPLEGAEDMVADDATSTEKDAGSREGEGPQELKLDGITFAVPGNWKRVKPETNIVEAEFELARAEGDEYDGRLTLMSSGGLPEDTISMRSGEFKFDPGEPAARDKIKLGAIEATVVDLRGEWKGSSFRPIPPRSDYRMLLVIIPFTERSAFYAKLTGPRATIAAHEDEFRDFLRTAQIQREKPAP